MSNFLSTSITGLLAFQRAIDATSHNIANVGTPGYSRQRVELVTRPSQGFGNGWVGQGVNVATTRRLYDDMVSNQVRVASSSFSHLDTYSTLMNRVNNLFSNTTTGLTPSLQKFANALQDVANNPTNSSARQVLISEANGLADRLRSYDAQLAQTGQQIEAQITGEVSEITTLTQGIAKLNDEIAAAYARTHQPPNDLLDQRDMLLDNLSAHLDISTVQQPDGQINVFTGSGQPLVVGKEASAVVTTTDPFDPTRHNVALRGPGGALSDITRTISGGSLGGAIAFRSEVLDPTRNELGRISVALTETINAQHRSGIDLSGAMGTDLFRVGGVETLGASSNTGTGLPTVLRTDTEALTTDDYVLQNTGTGWVLRNAATGAQVPMTGSGTNADPFLVNGLSIEVPAGSQTGDRYMIRPTRAATTGLDVLISDPSRIAAAAPFRTSASATNTGTGTISAGRVVDASDPNALRSTSTITFVDATTYTISGVTGTFTYTPGQPFVVNGAEVSISGAPAAGDTFTISDNTGGTGDNRNALALADSLSRGVIENGTTSLNQATSRLVGQVGSVTRQAQASRDAQEIVHKEAADTRDAISGVNLDEEAANLIKYQQAYQAAAQMIRVASSLFDTLLAATSRG